MVSLLAINSLGNAQRIDSQQPGQAEELLAQAEAVAVVHLEAEPSSCEIALGRVSCLVQATIVEPIKADKLHAGDLLRFTATFDYNFGSRKSVVDLEALWVTFLKHYPDCSDARTLLEVCGGWQLVDHRNGLQRATPELLDEIRDLLAAAQAPELAWEFDVPAEIRRAELSIGEDCIVLTTDYGVSVLNLDGRLRWERSFKSINRWMTAERSTAPAGCEWVAVVGRPEYRYVWVLTANGGGHYFRTRGTPEGVAIAHRGDRIAIGTAGGHLYILDSRARLIHDRDLGSAIIADLAFSKDDRHLIVTDGDTGVYTREGEPVWQPREYSRLAASADLSWFLGSREAPHGPAAGVAAVLNRDGISVWSRYGNGPKGAMAPDGSFFVISDNVCRDGWLCLGEDVVEGFQAMRPDGTLIASGSRPAGEVLAVADDSQSFLQMSSAADDAIVCLSRGGAILWQLPKQPYRDRIQAIRGDLGALLLSTQTFSRKGALRFYVRATAGDDSQSPSSPLVQQTVGSIRRSAVDAHPTARQCLTDAEKNKWLTACAWAVHLSRRFPRVDSPRDPWAVVESSDSLFEAEDHLAERLVDACFRLLEKPVAVSREIEDTLARIGWPPQACSRHVLTSWLAKCVQDAEALRPGTPRRVLLETFQEEGGLYSREWRTFIHKSCGMLKIHVTFSPARGVPGDSEHPDDEIETVTPYIGSFVVD
jgi:hypothetical protein